MKVVWNSGYEGRVLAVFASLRDLCRFLIGISTRIGVSVVVQPLPSPDHSVDHSRRHGQKVGTGKTMEQQSYFELFFRDFNLLDCNHRKWCKIRIGILKMLEVAKSAGSHLVCCGN